MANQVLVREVEHAQQPQIQIPKNPENAQSVQKNYAQIPKGEYAQQPEDVLPGEEVDDIYSNVGGKLKTRKLKTRKLKTRKLKTRKKKNKKRKGRSRK